MLNLYRESPGHSFLQIINSEYKTWDRLNTYTNIIRMFKVTKINKIILIPLSMSDYWVNFVHMFISVPQSLDNKLLRFNQASTASTNNSCMQYLFCNKVALYPTLSKRKIVSISFFNHKVLYLQNLLSTKIMILTTCITLKK